MNQQTRKLILISFLLLSVSGLVLGTLMSGGVWEIFKTLSASGAGNTSLSGGNFSLSQAAGQKAAKAVSGGAFELVSGYFQELGAFISSTTANVFFVEGDALLGIPREDPIFVTFSEEMSTATLAGALSVVQFEDELGNPVQSPVPVAFSYQPGTRVLTVTSASGFWPGNSMLRLDISTAAKSSQGFPLQSPVAKRIHTFIEQDQASIVKDSSDTVQVFLPGQSLPKDAYLIIKPEPIQQPDRANPVDIVSANNKVEALGGAVAAVKEINAYDRNRNLIQISSLLGSQATVTLKYQDADNNGVLDGGRARADSLSVRVLDEEKNLWVKVPGSIVDRNSKSVSAPIPHLSVFALVAALDEDVSDVMAFPVPWKPRAGNPARYGTLAEGITFINLPSQGSLKFYTVSGELVRDIGFSGGLLQLKWDGRNGSGQEVASGVYLWEMRSGDNRKTGKVMIVW